MSAAPGKPLSSEDMALCVAFVDGELERDAQLAFQRRMATEPDLAAAAQALLETDEMLRKLNAGTQTQLARVRRMRPWVWAASLAAAAALVFVIGRWSLTAGRAPSFEVALAPSFESPLDYIASQPSLAGQRPRGVDVQRGETQQPNIEAQEFLAKARTVEADVERVASVDISAGYFVVPIEVARDAEVVLYAFPAHSSRCTPANCRRAATCCPVRVSRRMPRTRSRCATSVVSSSASVSANSTSSSACAGRARRREARRASRAAPRRKRR